MIISTWSTLLLSVNPPTTLPLSKARHHCRLLHKVGNPLSKTWLELTFTLAHGLLLLLPPVIVGCITYLLIIFGGQFMLRDSPRYHPKFIFQLHNFLLTFVSAALLLLLIEQLIPQLVNHGFYYTICSSEAWTQKHELLYYLNYLVKWWELADTVFLVLKKKKLGKKLESMIKPCDIQLNDCRIPALLSSQHDYGALLHPTCWTYYCGKFYWKWCKKALDI